MRIINHAEVTHYTRVRTAIETDLAKDLYQNFDSPPIINTLREVVSLAVENMYYFINYTPGGLYDKETKNLVVFKRYHNLGDGQRGLKNLLDHWREWSASDCSDIIRLLAAVLEEPHKGLKVGPDEKPDFSDNVKDFATFKPEGVFYDMGKETKNIESWRWRVKPEDAPKKPSFTEPPKHVSAGRKQIDVERMVVHGERGKAFYGIQDRVLMPKSTVRKIDIAFGLPQGADISGTTADSIIVVNRVNTFFEACGQHVLGGLPEAVIQLLPLVTMVSLGHHTLLEAALTLTMHGFITYRIGFYSTLMPRTDKRKGLDESASGNMQRAMKNAESNKSNKHFLCYFHNGKYQARLYEERDELEQFRTFARTDEKFRKAFETVSVAVQKEDIDRIWPILANRPDS